MMSSLLSKQTLSEIIRAKNKLIEKERESFYRFRALLAHLDYDAYRKVAKEFTPEVKEASDEEFLKILDDLEASS